MISAKNVLRNRRSCPLSGISERRFRDEKLGTTAASSSYAVVLLRLRAGTEAGEIECFYGTDNRSLYGLSA